MQSAAPAPAAIRFASFEVDLRAGEVRKNGSLVKVQELPFRALVLLLEHPGQLVTREELRQRLWPADVFVDFEHGINSAINRLRDCLGDSADNPRFVQTIGRRGYRWIAPITRIREAVLTEGPSPPANLPGKAIETYAIDAHKFAATRKVALLAGIGLLILLGAGAFLRWRESRNADDQIHSIAVLPVQNLSGDPEQEYLSDGITDELITDLAKLTSLRVISRASVMHLKHTQKSLPEIARELNVDAIVEGTVQSSSGRLHVSAQLIQARPEKHLWAQSYDRSLGDAVTLQEELAREIVLAIHVRLTPPEKAQLAPRSRKVSPDAYQLYLKGRYFWNKRTREGFLRAIAYFQQAIAKEPDYAAAYAGLADSYLLLGGYRVAPQSETIPKARAAIQQALELDNSLADAHATLGMIAMNYDWNWAEAERQYREAIALNPNYATAHHWYAEYLALMGRFDEGLAEIQVAEGLDPLSVIISCDHGVILFLGRQYDSAIVQFRKTLEMDPDFVDARSTLLLAELQKGTFSPQNVAELERLQAADDSLQVSADLVYAYAFAGRRAEAQKLLQELRPVAKRRHVESTVMVTGYLGLGDNEQALDWLEKEYPEHSTGLTSLKVHPLYDPLRSDPRFLELMRRVGLAQ